MDDKNNKNLPSTDVDTQLGPSLSQAPAQTQDESDGAQWQQDLSNVCCSYLI